MTSDCVIGSTSGNLVAADAGKVWIQTPGTWDDVDTIGAVSYYVPLSCIVAPVHIAGVRSWKRTWALQLEGETFDSSSMTVVLVYGDYDTPSHTYQSVPLIVGPLEEEYRPTKQLSSSIQIGISDTQPLTKIATIIDIEPPSGPLFWYKADVGLTLDGSNRVQEWLDQSGNNFTMAPINNSTGYNPVSFWPTFHTNIINGLPAVRFSNAIDTATGQYLEYNGAIGTHLPSPDGAPITVLALLQPTDPNMGLVCTLRLDLLWVNTSTILP